jgi:hypothetical protein
MKPKPKRPLFVTLLAGVVFSLSAVSFASLAVGLARWQIFVDLDLSLPLWLLAASGGVWGLVWLVFAWGLWRLLPWARRGTMVCWVVYQVMTIGQQVLFARGSYERERLPFTVCATILLTALVIVGLMHPRVRQVFEDSNEQRVMNGWREGRRS